jgi:hypothetical protein
LKKVYVCNRFPGGGADVRVHVFPTADWEGKPSSYPLKHVLAPIMELDVAISAEEIKPLRIKFDFPKRGASVPANVPVFFLRRVKVVEVKSGRATAIAASLALPPKLLDEFFSKGSLKVPKAFLATLGAPRGISFPSLIAKHFFALDAVAVSLQFDRLASVGSGSRKDLPAARTATGSDTCPASRPVKDAPVSSVWDCLPTNGTTQRRVLFHAHIITPIGEKLNWGAVDQGSADLALSILSDWLGPNGQAKKHHQQFKWDFIAKPAELLVIDSIDIERWLAGQPD